MKSVPLAGTGVEYTELPMLFSAITLSVRSAAMTATSPSSSPRNTFPSMTIGEPQMAANMS